MSSAISAVAIWLALSSTHALQVGVMSGWTCARPLIPLMPWRGAAAPVASANIGDSASEERLQQFRAWLEAKGVVDEATPVRAERRDGWGLCLTSGRDISTGDVLLQVPRMLLLRPAAPIRVRYPRFGFLTQPPLHRCRVPST